MASNNEHNQKWDSYVLLLDEYKQMFLVPRLANSKKYLSKLSDLIIEYTEIKHKYVETLFLEAPSYNIFEILGVQRNEVRTHSAFLCHLLSPQASHGQGFLFLQSFLEFCAKKYPDNFPQIPSFEEINSLDWFVAKEVTSQFGRMDILLQNPNSGFLCVIENKIDALEGENQLSRYWDWIIEHENIFPNNVLLYLTINGDTSKTSKGKNYLPLSYRKDILFWLTSTIERIKPQSVKEVVRQYAGIIQKF